MAKDKELTVEKSMADFKKAYRAKRKLIEREREDFLFCLGKQWDDDKVKKLKDAGFKAITDNRIRPNMALLTGLERQNRSEFKAFPEGEEDSLKAEIASYLFKNSIKISDFGYKASECFEDGTTCGESYLELYLDNTENILNGKPCWTKTNGNMVFPAPGYKEYDFCDAPYVYKLTTDLSEDDLISLFPDCEKDIENCEDGKLNYESLMSSDAVHNQPKDYAKANEKGDDSIDDDDCCGYDLLERYYKKFVETFFIGDRQTGEIKEAPSQEHAEGFVGEYHQGIDQERQQFEQATMAYQQGAQMGQIDPQAVPPPPEPTPQDPERFTIIKRKVPEIWYFAHVPNIKKPLADERAWFYPKWKKYGLIPYMSNFSTAPIEGDDRHLLVQGIVHGVKGAQEKHNSSETLKIIHLNSSANGGWLTPTGSWVDPKKVAQFGATPGINLEYKPEVGKPERIFPQPLSQGHAQLAEESAESIKAILGINSDLLAAQQGGTDSGRAIALRQRQGLLMVQKLFDNFSRTKQICGKFLLSQLGDIYDTESAKKVLGESFLTKNFPPPMQMVPDQMGNPVMDPTGQPQQQPMQDPKTGQPMTYDTEMAEIAIAEVLKGDLGQYDVAVGESVASETMKMANAAEMKEIAQSLPGIIPPELLVEESQLPQSTKTRILASIKQAQAMAAQAQQQPMQRPMPHPQSGQKETVNA